MSPVRVLRALVEDYGVSRVLHCLAMLLKDKRTKDDLNRAGRREGLKEKEMDRWLRP